MPLPSGAHYTDSSRHFVRLASGETVRRAEAENIHARERGYSSNYDRRQAYRALGGAQKAREIGGKGTDPDASIRAYRDLQADYRANGNDYRRIDRSGNGPLATWLRSIGRKSEYDFSRVGDS